MHGPRAIPTVLEAAGYQFQHPTTVIGWSTSRIGRSNHLFRAKRDRACVFAARLAFPLLLRKPKASSSSGNARHPGAANTRWRRQRKIGTVRLPYSLASRKVAAVDRLH
ncbi:DUF1731 domain-containing protein [Nocardia cyriacigeorgica]|uniref:DUF1731 domain-containing protein n=1 Tax=Nocardia cyriacigeorgica TaxID=135487 RepID=UPI002453A5F7|nr:DUF1731 domain-containing protein [Nocardia cyriacigeorgica]